MSGRELLAHYIRTGWTDDEIVERLGARALQLDPIPPDWDRQSPGSPPGLEVFYLGDPPEVRRLRTLLREMRGIAAETSASDHWLAIVTAYRKCGPRPLQVRVARQMNLSVSQLRRWYQAEGCATWPDVHARIAAEEARRS